MQIEDHSFLITGAASGLGAACARLLAAQGAKLHLLDQSIPDEHELGDVAKFIRCDVTKQEQVASAVMAYCASTGRCTAPSIAPGSVQSKKSLPTTTCIA